MEMTLAKKANQIEYEIIQSRGKKLFDQHGLETGKVIRAMAVSRAKRALAKEQSPIEQPEEMKEDKLREMVRTALSKPLNEKKGKDMDGDGDIDSKDYMLARDAAIKKAKGKVEESERENDRYMFFSNLEQIRRQCDLLLDLDRSMIEQILDDGHDWAQDHVAEAKSFLDQAFDFIMNETKQTNPLTSITVDEAKEMTSSQKKKRGEIYDALKAQGMSDEKAGRIATSKAMKKKIKEAILAKLKESENEYAKIEKEIAQLTSKGKTLRDPEMVKLVKRRAELEKSKK